jgi:hypothetical protein
VFQNKGIEARQGIVVTRIYDRLHTDWKFSVRDLIFCFTYNSYGLPPNTERNLQTLMLNVLRKNVIRKWIILR